MHENVHQNVFFFFFFFLLFKSNLINSEIQSFKIITDSRSLIMFEDFGFNNPGYISISISSISITTRSMNPTNSSLMGCFYAPSPARRAMKLALLNDYCIIGKPFIFPIFVFNERTLLSQSSINKTIPVTIPDLYYIFFLNCAKTSSISMNVDLETYNIKPNGDPYYTDEHFTNLPSTLFTFSFLFFVFLLIWLRLCIKNKYFLHRIHILMALLLFFRFLDLFSYAKTQHVIRLTGLSHGWNVLWLVVYFVKNILFVNVIVLIGAGWSLLRPCLQEFHKYVLSIAVSLQILANLCFVLMRGFGPSNEHYSKEIGSTENIWELCISHSCLCWIY
ncbi:hypothetical protein ACJIZ3_010352 [Penstemon smallii]|uniref:Intimal thickness related receptor IRP domain-containing protein n=1 Tax=Penstemon smallii TaxID=265156 RepID=A0ABD3TG97_9LAMI